MDITEFTELNQFIEPLVGHDRVGGDEGHINELNV
jgi:hypothetical protein